MPYTSAIHQQFYQSTNEHLHPCLQNKSILSVFLAMYLHEAKHWDNNLLSNSGHAKLDPNSFLFLRGLSPPF